MLKIRPIIGRPIPIGRRGEHLSRAIDFGDIIEFFESVYGSGTPEVRYMRPADTSAYVPSFIDTTDGGCVWKPTSTDTANAGTGRLEIRWLVNGKVAKSRVYDVSVEDSIVLDGDNPDEHEYYPGPYVVTPSDEEQVLETGDCIAVENIVIEKIPSTYGHIDYNGFNLRVY